MACQIRARQTTNRNRSLAFEITPSCLTQQPIRVYQPQLPLATLSGVQRTSQPSCYQGMSACLSQFISKDGRPYYEAARWIGTPYGWLWHLQGSINLPCICNHLRFTLSSTHTTHHLCQNRSGSYLPAPAALPLPLLNATPRISSRYCHDRVPS